MERRLVRNLLLISTEVAIALTSCGPNGWPRPVKGTLPNCQGTVSSLHTIQPVKYEENHWVTDGEPFTAGEEFKYTGGGVILVGGRAFCWAISFKHPYAVDMDEELHGGSDFIGE